MARWRLTQKHYLNVPGTTYEHKETSNYGKQVRKNYNVPLFLDPEDPGDCNYNYGGESRSPNQNGAGEIIVAYATGAERPRDIIFEGPPTIDMVPLDEEAKAISEEMRAAWGRSYITEDVDEGGFSNRLLHELSETLNAFNATSKPVSAVAEDGKIAALEAQIKQMLDINTALIAKLEPPARRV